MRRAADTAVGAAAAAREAKLKLKLKTAIIVDPAGAAAYAAAVLAAEEVGRLVHYSSVMILLPPALPTAAKQASEELAV